MNQIHPKATGMVDKQGLMICIGDVVKRHDSILGKIINEYEIGAVVFVNGAFRVKVLQDYNSLLVPKEDSERMLQYNKSLVFDEVLKTKHIEIVKEE